MYPPPLRPVRTVRNFALAALALYSVVAIAVALIDLQEAAFIERMLVDPTVTDAEISFSDAVVAVFSLAELAATLLAMVAFMVWLYRVRANAEILAPEEHRRAKIWLVAGWIVPIVSWWFPKQIVDDIWTASHRRGPEPSSRAGLVTGWWAAWLVGSWLSYVAGRLFLRAEELEAMANADRFDVVCIAVMLVAAGLAAKVIYRISNAQEERRLEPVQQQPGDGWAPGAVQQPGDGWVPGAVQQRTGEGA
jgi:hypothetical protein